MNRSTAKSVAIETLLHARRRAFSVKGGARLWSLIWKGLTSDQQSPISIKVHGTKAFMNSGYSYPLFSRQYPSYNQPLIQIVHLVFHALERPIKMVDIGAAIGDTVLLVGANVPGAVEKYFCIDGDPQFSVFLAANLGAREDCVLYNVMLSANEEAMPSLVRTHYGTASAQGEKLIMASTLDAVLQGQSIDLIKVDIDGFDGRALAGSRETLAGVTAVIFEWHPLLCEQTRNDWKESFHVLRSAGFTDFVWYGKEGSFSHITKLPSDNELDSLAAYCLADVGDDHHWDVVALKTSSKIDLVELARMRFAASRPSRW